MRSFHIPASSRRSGSLVVLIMAVLSPLALAQDDKMTPIPIPKQPGAIELGTGKLPEATAPESWHFQYGRKFARNVSVATLTPFLPPKSKATGAAVIVAPGGGFRTLSMENEGWDVAKALNKRGVAAFVLKYRLIPTPADLAEFAAPPRPGAGGPPRRPPSGDPSQAFAPQIADATAAFALVRSRAAEWNIDPTKVGMIGFSAGAMLTMSTALYGKDINPAFLGDIYGPLAAVKVPANAPPLFIALASDDPLMGNGGFGLIESWKAAKRPVEFHLYEQGGHGFGMYNKETTSTGWFEAFASWLRMHGFIKK
ncbi:MAG: alpha/beta hydrolase fold domain-containing protein [Armatimonadetes bacterium]|nr:alpha/beta hydrolase fold domain-containing protein [Armatimonadota bacterium]